MKPIEYGTKGLKYKFELVSELQSLQNLHSIYIYIYIKIVVEL